MNSSSFWPTSNAGGLRSENQRRDPTPSFFGFKSSSLSSSQSRPRSSDELYKIDKAQAIFWRSWKARLEDQKLVVDRTKVLEQLIPGVESGRFLSGDLDYIRNSVVTLIESVRLEKKHILKDVLKLADTYGLSRSEVLLKFLTSVLVSEAWSNTEITSEIAKLV